MMVQVLPWRCRKATPLCNAFFQGGACRVYGGRNGGSPLPEHRHDPRRIAHAVCRRYLQSSDGRGWKQKGCVMPEGLPSGWVAASASVWLLMRENRHVVVTGTLCRTIGGDRWLRYERALTLLSKGRRGSKKPLVLRPCVRVCQSETLHEALQEVERELAALSAWLGEGPQPVERRRVPRPETTATIQRREP